MSTKGLLATAIGAGAGAVGDIARIELGTRLDDRKREMEDQRQKALLDLQRKYAKEDQEIGHGYRMAELNTQANIQAERDQRAGAAQAAAAAADRDYEGSKMMVEQSYKDDAAYKKYLYDRDIEKIKADGKAKESGADIKLGKYRTDLADKMRQTIAFKYNVNISPEGALIGGDDSGRRKAMIASEIADLSSRFDPYFDESSMMQVVNNATALADRGWLAPSQWTVDDKNRLVIGESVGEDGKPTPIVADPNAPAIRAFIQNLPIGAHFAAQTDARREAPPLSEANKSPAVKATAPMPPPPKGKPDDQFASRLQSYIDQSKAEDARQSAPMPPGPLSQAQPAPIRGEEANQLAKSFTRVNELAQRIVEGRAYYGEMANISPVELQQALRFAEVTGRAQDAKRIRQMIETQKGGR